MPENITIIGAGAMGTMCALVLADNGYQVTLWGRDKPSTDKINSARENKKYLPGFKLPENIHLTSDIKLACAKPKLFISAIPTQHIREVWQKFAPNISRAAPVVSVAKGIESNTLLLPTQIIEDVLKKVNKSDQSGYAHQLVAALSGPSIALEIAQKKPATLCAAARGSSALSAKIQELFTTNYLRIYTTSDLIGVELAGATKNVIALAAGMLDGLEAGINAKSALLSRGLAEIARLGAKLGAKRETFFGVAGGGDLATTCFSPTGRNRSCGEFLGQGCSLDEALNKSKGIVEGVATTGAVIALAKKHQVDMPITEAVNSVLFENLSPTKAIKQLMTRNPKQSERIGQ